MLCFYRSIIIGLAVSGFTIAHAATDCNQVTEIPVSECQELLALYNSATEDNFFSWHWIGWNESNTPCNWEGVTCANGHVIKLTPFFYVGSRTEIPDLNLPELLELSIRAVGAVSFPDFSHSPKLQSLSVSIGSGSLPDFSHLPELQSLSVYYNFEFEGNIPNFTNLPNLKSLYVSNNNGKWSGNIPDFSNLPNLKELKLDLSKISNIPNFSNLPNLEQLTFNTYNGTYYGIGQFAPDYLRLSTVTLPDFNLPKLTHLHIFGVNLTGNSVPNFSKLPNLVVLNLQSNGLAGSIPNFSNLPNLVTLELAYNYLTGNIPNFSNLPNLGGLNLVGNYLTGSIPNFSNLPSLLGINLKNNLLTGVIPNFAPLSNVNPIYSMLGENCGFTSYDKTQETLLNQVLPDWANPKKQSNIATVSCSALTTCPTATISPLTLNLHIPTLSYNNSNMSANLRFVQRDGKVFFELIDYKVNSALLEPIDCIDDPAVTCKKPKPSCSSANLSPDFKLHIPTAIFGDMKLWADLQLHSVENNKITFELVNYGNT